MEEHSFKRLIEDSDETLEVKDFISDLSALHGKFVDVYKAMKSEFERYVKYQSLKDTNPIQELTFKTDIQLESMTLKYQYEIQWDIFKTDKATDEQIRNDEEYLTKFLDGLVALNIGTSTQEDLKDEERALDSHESCVSIDTENGIISFQTTLDYFKLNEEKNDKKEEILSKDENE